MVYVDSLSNVSVADVNFNNNLLDAENTINAGLLRTGQSSNVELNNLNILDNNISASIYIQGMVYVDALSNVSVADINFNNNLLDAEGSINGGLLRTGQSSKVELNNLNILDNNISASRHIQGMVYVDALSNVSVADVNFNNNLLDAESTIYGGLLRTGQSSNVELSNLNILDNNISASNNIQGVVYVDSLSNVSVADVNFNNNLLDAKNMIRGGFIIVINGTCTLSNITFKNNNVLNYYQFYSFIRTQANSTIVLTDVHFYRNYMSGEENFGSILSAVKSAATVNYCYIEDNCNPQSP